MIIRSFFPSFKTKNAWLAYGANNSSSLMFHYSLLEYANNAYTGIHNYSHIQKKQLPKTQTERVLYLEVNDIPDGLRDYPQRSKASVPK